MVLQVAEQADQVVQVLQRRARRPPRRRHGHPPVGHLGHPSTGQLAVAAQPDRWPGLLGGRRLGGVPLGRHELALEVDGLTGPGQLQDLEVLVDAGVAGLEVDAEGGELGLHVPDPGTEDEAPARQDVDRGRGLGQQEGVAVGDDGQVGEEPQGRGPIRHDRQGHERVEGVMPPALPPPLARGRVLGDIGRPEAGLLG